LESGFNRYINLFDFERESGIRNPKKTKIIFFEKSILRGNSEFGIRKFKKIFFFENFEFSRGNPEFGIRKNEK